MSYHDVDIDMDVLHGVFFRAASSYFELRMSYHNVDIDMDVLHYVVFRASSSYLAV